MLRAAVRAFARSFLTAWLSIVQRMCFSEMVVVGELPNNHASVLLVSNHISWWDGIWVMLLNLRHWKRDFKVLMLHRELEKRPFLSLTGAIPLYPDRRMPQSVQIMEAILAANNSLLLIFPEGEIRPAAQSVHSFKTGLIKRLHGKSGQLCFLYQAVEYANRVRPISFHFLKCLESGAATEIEGLYTEFVHSCRHKIAQHIAAIIRE